MPLRVSVTPQVWVWKRSVASRIRKRSFRSLAQSRLAARNFAASSKRSLWAPKKKERPEATSAGSRPRAFARARYASPFESVKPTSWAAVAPASRMW